jgi:hypothetical protein
LRRRVDDALPRKVPLASNSGCADAIPIRSNSSRCKNARIAERRASGATASGAIARVSASAIGMVAALL